MLRCITYLRTSPSRAHCPPRVCTPALAAGKDRFGERQEDRVLQGPGRRLGSVEKREQGAAGAGHRRQGREDPAVGQPARRLRLPRLRLARPQPRVHLRVLRERRQGRRRRGHGAPRHARVLRPAHRDRAGRQERLLPGGPGPARRAHGLRPRQRQVPAHRLGRRVRAGGQAPERPARPEPGDVLHLGPRQQRGRVPVPAVRARIRHQQLPRLLQHVPRAQRLGDAAAAGRRQGHRHAGRLRAGRRDPDLRPEPRHQPSAHAGRAARGRQARRADRQLQPAARARPGALRRSAGQAGDGHARLDPHQHALLPAARRRRLRAGQGHDEAPGGAGGRARRRPRPRLHRAAHGRHRGAAGRPARRVVAAARTGVGPVGGADARGRRRLPGGQERHRVLGHGHHAAPALGGDDPDDRQPAAAAREHGPARRRRVSGTRPQQRAGRPHDGHLGEAARRAARPPARRVRLRAAARARRRRRRGDQADARRPRQGLRRARRQLRRRHAGHLRDLEGAAPVRPPSSIAATSCTGARR